MRSDFSIKTSCTHYYSTKVLRTRFSNLKWISSKALPMDMDDVGTMAAGMVLVLRF